jgi:hypothetical protein
MRVSPAMSLGDSILQTASIARCVSAEVTPTDHIIFNPSAQVREQDYPIQIANSEALLYRARNLPFCSHRQIPQPQD